MLFDISLSFPTFLREDDMCVVEIACHACQSRVTVPECTCTSLQNYVFNAVMRTIAPCRSGCLRVHGRVSGQRKMYLSSGSARSSMGRGAESDAAQPYRTSNVTIRLDTTKILSHHSSGVSQRFAFPYHPIRGISPVSCMTNSLSGKQGDLGTRLSRSMKGLRLVVPCLASSAQCG